MMALTGNSNIYNTASHPNKIVERAEELADAFINKPTIEDKNGNPV